MVGFAATFATATSSGKNAVEYGVIVGIGTLYGVVLARRFKAPEIVEGQRVPSRPRFSSRSCLALLSVQRGDRRGTRMDRALLGSGASSAAHPLRPDGKTRANPGKGDWHRRRGPRRDTRRDSPSPSALATSVIAGVAFLLSFAVYFRSILALLRPVDVRARSRLSHRRPMLALRPPTAGLRSLSASAFSSSASRSPIRLAIG